MARKPSSDPLSEMKVRALKGFEEGLKCKGLQSIPDIYNAKDMQLKNVDWIDNSIGPLGTNVCYTSASGTNATTYDWSNLKK